MAFVETVHVEKPVDGPARLLRLPRVRIAQIVMDYLAHGWSPDEMCRHYPHLMLVEVHAAMAYYLDHREEIDAEVRTELDEIRISKLEVPSSPFELRMRAKGIL